MEVERCPKTLIVTLKRFQCVYGGVGKVGTQVDIGERMGCDDVM